MKQKRERRGRVAPYSIGKPNIYGPTCIDFASQTENSETTESIPPTQSRNINPSLNENNVSDNPTSTTPVPKEHSNESCIICFLEFFFILSSFFSEDLVKTRFFYYLANYIFTTAIKISKNCPAAHSQTVLLEDIIQDLD